MRMIFPAKSAIIGPMDKPSANPTISELARADRDRPSLRPLMILEICKYGGAVLVLYVILMFSISYLSPLIGEVRSYANWLFDPDSGIPDAETASTIEGPIGNDVLRRFRAQRAKRA